MGKVQIKLDLDLRMLIKEDYLMSNVEGRYFNKTTRVGRNRQVLKCDTACHLSSVVGLRTTTGTHSYLHT